LLTYLILDVYRCSSVLAGDLAQIELYLCGSSRSVAIAHAAELLLRGERPSHAFSTIERLYVDCC